MKKVINYGPARGFWWHTNFEKFMNNQRYIERLSTDVPMLMTNPRVWHSNLHLVTIQYFMENTLCPEFDGAFVQRSKVTLWGSEGDILALETIIRSGAKAPH